MSVVATSFDVGCDAGRNKDESLDAGSPALASAAKGVAVPGPSAPRQLYLPNGEDVAMGSEYSDREPTRQAEESSGHSSRCPPDMVDVAGAFCIDRYEAHLVDANTGQALSPYYPPESELARKLRDRWQREQPQAKTALGRALSVPELPLPQVHGGARIAAESEGNTVPSGYLNGNVAEEACRNKGKRLCKPSEWVTACRGEQNRQYPYGHRYVDGKCNVHREAHPAALLHGNPSEGHLDPRLNLAKGERGSLLRKTGETATCKSEWGSDAIYDMVGNLDEWVEDEQGSFHGGFYARASTAGCDARIASHPREYRDYSLGVRCCK